MSLTRVGRSDSVSTRNVGDGTGELGAESVGRPIEVQREGWSVGGEGAAGGVTGGWVVGTGTSDSMNVGEGTGGLGAGSVEGPSGGGWSVEEEGGVTGGWVLGTGTSDSVDVGEATGE